MESGYLIDTNTAIDYLDNKLPENSSILIEQISAKISVITRMELLGWSNASIEQSAILQQFVNASIIYNLEEAVILKAIELRKSYKTKLPDAIIAATAIIYNLTLITRNIADFKNINELSVIDSFQV